ncbi:hypothetical protein HK097_001792 [Rhizophlyctis rosea]|uniref:RRM domain-containing protein n=1 Tax=Rhizophlyctis rosea TaxID=64517 RepID=A0AAD5SGR7_9FUNG|nr:hypothetical protein HK097_001792 [Rhizophlyctis rosea]
MESSTPATLDNRSTGPSTPEGAQAVPDGGVGQNNANIQYIEETGKYVSTDADGISYEWDAEKNAWFPMYDESLVDLQQSVYSVEGVDETVPIPERRGKRKKEKVYTYDEPMEKKPKTEPKKKPNTSVYVTGLPHDATVDEVKEVFEKYGILMVDMSTGEPRIKLYRDAGGNIKGDALVTYFKEESIALACELLDDSDFRPGQSSRIRVQPAVFQEKEKPPTAEGQASTSNGAAPKKNFDKKKVQKQMQKLGK